MLAYPTAAGSATRLSGMPEIIVVAVLVLAILGGATVALLAVSRLSAGRS